MATIKRIGYGQVEPNHLSAQRTGQIYAQLPADSSIEVLENGQFVKYDYTNGKVDTTGKGEWMLVFNEIKLYDERKQMYKDYAQLKSEAVDGVIVPRVFKTNIGDIYTTNCVEDAYTNLTNYSISAGDLLKVSDKGYLVKGGNISTDSMVWEVVKVYTLADGQPAIKVMRVK